MFALTAQQAAAAAPLGQAVGGLLGAPNTGATGSAGSVVSGAVSVVQSVVPATPAAPASSGGDPATAPAQIAPNVVASVAAPVVSKVRDVGRSLDRVIGPPAKAAGTGGKTDGAGGLLPRGLANVASSSLGLARHAVVSTATRALAAVHGTVASVTHTVVSVGNTVAAGLDHAVSTTTGKPFGAPPAGAPQPIQHDTPTPPRARPGQTPQRISASPADPGSARVGAPPAAAPAGTGISPAPVTAPVPFGVSGGKALAAGVSRLGMTTPTSMTEATAPTPASALPPVAPAGSRSKASGQGPVASPQALSLPSPVLGGADGSGGVVRSIGGQGGTGGVLGLLFLVALASLARGRGPRLGLLPLGKACHAFLSPLERPG